MGTGGPYSHGVPNILWNRSRPVRSLSMAAQPTSSCSLDSFRPVRKLSAAKPCALPSVFGPNGERRKA